MGGRAVTSGVILGVLCAGPAVRAADSYCAPTDLDLSPPADTALQVAAGKASAKPSADRAPKRAILVLDPSRGMDGFVRQASGTRTHPPIFRQVVIGADAALQTLASDRAVSIDYRAVGSQKKGGISAETLNLSRALLPCDRKLSSDAAEKRQRCPGFEGGARIKDFIEALWSPDDPLRLGADDLVILITDLQDEIEGQGAGPLGLALRAHLQTGERSVLIVPFKSRYEGWVFDLPGYRDKGHQLDGVQPFYVIVIGAFVHVDHFRTLLETHISKELEKLSLKDNLLKDVSKKPLLFFRRHPDSERAVLPKGAVNTRVRPADFVSISGQVPILGMRGGLNNELNAYSAYAYSLKEDIIKKRLKEVYSRDIQIISMSISHLSDEGPDAGMQTCWGLGQGAKRCVAQGSDPSPSADRKREGVEVAAWKFGNPPPTPMQWASQQLGSLVGAQPSCDDHRDDWERFKGSLPFDIVASIENEQSEGVDTFGRRLQLRATVRFSDDWEKLDIRPPAVVLVHLKFHLEHDIRGRQEGWVRDWTLSRARVDHQIQLVRTGVEYTFGTGGLQELFSELYQASLANSQTSNRAYQSELLLFEVTP